MSIDYGIEWAYGEFRIARLKHGQVVESWKSPTPVTDLPSLNEAMYEAAYHVDISRGGSVAIAYEDDLHTHEFLEVPPLSHKDLDKFLIRRVVQDKPFEDEAAWRHHPVAKGTNVDGVILHLMPKYIVDAVMRICEEFYLKPKLLVPLTEIMSEYVPKLGKDDDEALLMIALFDDRTQMLISSGCGEILFVRELSYPWSPETSSRLSTDINRTIGYSKQRIEGELNQAYMIGENAKLAKEDLESRIDVELIYNELAAKAEFWMIQVAGLPQGLSSNFIPALARQSITGKTFLRAAVMMSGVTVLSAILLCGSIEYVLFKSGLDSASLSKDVLELEENLERMQTKVDFMKLESAKLDILNVDSFNLPAIFLSHLSELLPPELVLTKVEVTDQDGTWDIQLNGLSSVALSDSAPALAQLEKSLTGEPWNTQITQSWETSWMKQLNAGSATQENQIGFEIKGQFR